MPGSIAPLVAGWNRWRTGFSPPPASPLGGEIPGTRKVELFIGEQWVDITRLDRDTSGVYYRDSITITRGKSDEAASLDRSTCRFTLNNRDGRFSPRNPTSPYYGLLGRNTPVRVSVVQATGIRRYRFYGEVSSWPQHWDPTGTDVYVSVEASGILRRLGQGSTPLKSPLYRGCSFDTDHLVAYWPCEDAASATNIGSAVTGVSAMIINGTPTLASDSTSFVASDSLPVMANASFVGTVPTYSTSLDQAQVRFVMEVPAAGATNGQIICAVTTTGTAVRWELYYGTGGTLGLRGFDAGNVNIADTAPVAFAVDGKALRVSLEFIRTSGNIAATITTLQVGSFTGSVSGCTATGYTLGRVNRVYLAYNRGLTTTTIGHILVQSKVTRLFDIAAQFNAWNSETAGARIGRLCGENGINFYREPPAGTSVTMGNQGKDTLLNLINDCVDADMGRLFEPRDQVGLAYRDRESLYDQTADLALSYSAYQLADILEPVDDDTYTRNDVTVDRDGGSSSRATKDTGVLSIASVGRYDTSVTLKVATDAQLTDLAGWLLHLGTIDEARYPKVSIDLLHPTFSSSDTLTTAALVLNIADRITITGLPSWLPPNDVSLIVEGYTETIGGNGQHTITFNCSPESPFHVPIYDNATYRYSSDGSTLTSALDSATTSVSVTTASGPIWSVTDGSFDINIAGERMTVTGISGSSSPQTFTVTRSVNGVVKAHAVGEDVSLFTPAYYGI